MGRRVAVAHRGATGAWEVVVAVREAQGSWAVVATLAVDRGAGAAGWVERAQAPEYRSRSNRFLCRTTQTRSRVHRRHNRRRDRTRMSSHNREAVRTAEAARAAPAVVEEAVMATAGMERRTRPRRLGRRPCQPHKGQYQARSLTCPPLHKGQYQGRPLTCPPRTSTSRRMRKATVASPRTRRQCAGRSRSSRCHKRSC